jgi:hypothetical protein
MAQSTNETFLSIGRENSRGRENSKLRSVEDKIILFFVESQHCAIDFNLLADKITATAREARFEELLSALSNLAKEDIIDYALQKIILVKKDEAIYRALNLKRRSTAKVLCSLLIHSKNLILRGYEVSFNRDTFLLHSNEYIAYSNIFTSANVFYHFIQELKGKGLIEKVKGKDEYILLYGKIPKELLNLVFSLPNKRG